MKIVIIGGTGQIGKRVAAILSDQGHEVLAASPSNGVNSVTGQGLAAALEGAEVVVDVTNAPSWEAAAVLQFFQTSTTNLLRAEAAAGTVRHHVALSIVGAERLPESPYMVAKVAQERLIEAGAIPYTIVRATQFFEFLGMIGEAGAQADGTVRTSSAALQPIAVADVAALVAGIAASGPANGTVDIAGPDKLPLHQLVERALRAKGDSRPVTGTPETPYFGAILEDSSLTPLGSFRCGAISLDQWLR